MTFPFVVCVGGASCTASRGRVLSVALECPSESFYGFWLNYQDYRPCKVSVRCGQKWPVSPRLDVGFWKLRAKVQGTRLQ